jgi:alpha-1,6-mannosyltransferase
MKKETLLFLLTFLAYVLIAYAVPRSNFYSFFVLFSLVFGIYFYWIRNLKVTFDLDKFSTYFFAAILLRVVFIFALPQLSDDFWRYLWDGRLLSKGINPYCFTPADLIGQSIVEKVSLAPLFENLNSRDYYSVYPPVNQIIFSIVSFLFPDNVFAAVFLLHIIMILFEAGTVYILAEILRIMKKPVYLAFVYAFNPLVILELSGNLHTEGTMLFFVLLALLFFLKNRLNLSALVFGLAVCSKLLPLMFLPLILFRLWFREGFRYCATVLFVSVFLFIPFLDMNLIIKISSSFSLYFSGFEFNAGIYYLFRYVLIADYWQLWDYHPYFMNVSFVEEFLGLDIHALLRKLLPFVDVIVILYLSFRKTVRLSYRSFFVSFLFIYSFHLFLSTTVHPWYITPLILFSIFTSYRFTLLWSYLIGLSYISYHSGVFQENFYLIFIEYLLVFSFLFYEVYSKRSNFFIR